MTELDPNTIPRVVLVFNGPLQMSPGKMAAQAFQVCQRLYHDAILCSGPGLAQGELADRVLEWERHTTTIARVAKTTAMFERVCAEVPGVVMVDEGWTEVDPDTPTVFASWPATRVDEHKLLSNAKVTLLRDKVDPFAAWDDEQLVAIGQGLALAYGNVRDLAGGIDEILEEMRAEAKRRHLRLLAGEDLVAPEQWLT